MILNTNLNDTARLHALQLTDAEDIFGQSILNATILGNGFLL